MSSTRANSPKHASMCRASRVVASIALGLAVMPLLSVLFLRLFPDVALPYNLFATGHSGTALSVIATTPVILMMAAPFIAFAFSIYIAVKRKDLPARKRFALLVAVCLLFLLSVLFRLFAIL
ncbi:MAG: hypothetical protein Q4B05_01715 [Candidatus Saccharibacteria bacterium]|nr:hypothetical protein [Candidatus Saccharibacteria bacterium]